MPSTLSRRRLLSALGVSAAGLLSGCAESLPTSDSKSTSAIRFHLHELGTSLRERHVVDLTETRAPWDEDAFAAALNGSAYTIQHRPPFPRSRPDDPAYVRHEGTYYHLDSVVVDQATVDHPVLRLFEASDAEAPADPTAHGDLPQVDKRAVQVAYMAARARGNQGGVPWGLVERGGAVYRTDREQSSVLDGDLSYVRFRNSIYRIETTTETFHEAVYRPDVEPVADTDAGMERILEAQLVGARLSRDALSQAEREILREARGEGYEAEYPYPEAMNSLLRKLHERAYIDGNVSKDALGERADHPLLKYGETYYEYRLRLAES